MRSRILVVLLGFVAAALAQDTRARLQGLVTDSTQAVVLGARVTLINDNTGVQTFQTTNEVGQYLFDFVLPGNYTVTVDMAGFRKFVQKNVLVQSRGDVTVNAVLELGAVGESITVEASPVAIQFNTSTMALTLDTKMANNLPIIHRNPFLLVSLNPAVVLRSSTEQSPFHHWAASQFDVGGNTNTKNDIILDGAPSMTTQKSTYTPPMDAVQEVNLQQNSVDAEFGHSAGGVLSVQMKSGTNEYHGTAYYLGRHPKLNAIANSINRAPNLTRQHVWGGTLGSPIRKNKIFSFFSYEGWRTIEPRNTQVTLPTDREREGDFSTSLNIAGRIRQIYDPFSTRLDAAGAVTRDPFPGNRIPSTRIDPTARKIMGDLWKPNRAGDDITGVNNFVKGFANRFRYWNLSERVDWNISDKWKVFGRYTQFRTFTAQDDYTGGSIAQPVDGSKRHSLSISGDAVWTINPTTVFNIRAAYNSLVDDFGVPSQTLKESDLEKFWPGNSWYKPYLADLPDIYYPGMTIRAASTTTLGRTGYWWQEPDSYNIESKMSKNIGKHYWKVGGEFRHENVNAFRPRPMSFDFRADHTADTFLAPNTRERGDAWATFLLGALDGNSTISSIPVQRPRVDYLALFVHDEWKLAPNISINAGVRYEYYTAMRDPDDRFSRFLDLTSPIPEFQGANAPQLPAEVTALRTAAAVYNGAWIFSDKDKRGSWNPQNFLLMPRAGVAWRIGPNTALRVGYARYIVPPTLADGLSILGSVPLPGFDATTSTNAPIAGVPQQRLADPYPGGLTPVVGKALGRYTNLGTAGTWYEQDTKAGVNDRINVSLQRQLPFRILADITYFANIGRDAPYTKDLNQVDPRIGYRVGSAVTRSVANPFFNLLPASKMPGPLRTQRNVAVSALLRPYPQYAGLTETLRGARANRYQALQLQFQRPFVNGFNFVVGYNYNRERNEEFFDEQDQFTDTLTWQPAPNARHRLTGAGIYEIPVGRGRRYLANPNRLVDGILGGWSVSTLFTYNSGFYLRFPTQLVSGDPKLDTPTIQQWFDTSKFQRQPAFTRRTNPLQFPGLTGPRFVNFDSTLAKEFPIKERLKFELRMEAYNMMNSFTGANPILDVNLSTFGRITSQRAGIFGRQFQYSGRFIW
jgi:hypothetical protein